MAFYKRDKDFIFVAIAAAVVTILIGGPLGIGYYVIIKWIQSCF